MKKAVLVLLCAVMTIAQYTQAGSVLPGKFSVGPNQQVMFSAGNLQYQVSSATYRFAEHQYDVLSKWNQDNSYADWIDLFSWGTSDDPTSVSYAPTFVDWGTHAISNGGNTPNMWRTLTGSEWNYLFERRPNASNLRGQATVNNVHGYILLPDDWRLPQGLTFRPQANNWVSNNYNASQWMQMEQHGAVFLPAAGVRRGRELLGKGEMGATWSSTMYQQDGKGEVNAKMVYFMIAKASANMYDTWKRGFSVRLVTSLANAEKIKAQPVTQYTVTRPATQQTTSKPTYQQTTSRPTYQQQTTSQPKNATVTVAGVLPGLFSIAAGRQVQFAQGNVQYQPSTNTWRFADNQYDRVGHEEVGNVYDCGQKCQNEKINSKVYTGWLDLFGWGTGNNPTEYKMVPTYYENFVDWGKNAFVNGGNTPNMWRTLSGGEWTYLFERRPNARNLRGQAVVNNVKGYILLPDNWTAPSGLSFRPEPENMTANIYSAAQWERMEKNGAVFLPAASYRTLLNLITPDDEGCYWSSSWYNKEEDEASYMWFYTKGSGPTTNRATHNGHSVRLVLNMNQVAKPAPKVISQSTTPVPAQPAQPKPVVTNSGKTNPVPKGGLPGIFSVSANKKVYFSMGNAQYNEDGYSPTEQFAEHQWDIVGDATRGDVYYKGVKCDNTKLKRGFAGWADLFEWGGDMSQNSAVYVYSTFFGYKEWGERSFQNGGYPENGLWRTLTGDEWAYLFDQRPNARNLRGQATVNNHHGYVLLPDAWQIPQGLSFRPQPNNWTTNTYTADQWKRMEQNGAVFLPAAGVRVGKEIQGINEIGSYWSSTMHNQRGEGDVDARGISFSANSAKSSVYDTWHHGFSVRLVQDIDFVKPEKKSVWADVPANQLAQLPDLEPEGEWKLYDDMHVVGDINPRDGFRRVKVSKGSFAEFLRNYKLKDDWTLYYYNGERVKNQFGAYAVMDIDIGTRDLLQCADAVMLLRAEYLYSQKRYKEIHFNALSGKRLNYTDYVGGDYSRAKFRKYMDYVFAYANTASLEKEMKTRKIEDIQIGDVFITSGNPGHAMIVVDMAVDQEGNRALLFAQGMMPAQSVHVVTNLEHGEDTPWYLIDKYLDWGSVFVFPNYAFSVQTDLKCFE